MKETFSLHGGDQNVDTTIWPLLDNENKPIGTMGIAINGKSRARFYENLKNNEDEKDDGFDYCDYYYNR